MAEELRRIPGFQNYAISCDGLTVKNIITGKALKAKREKGYLMTALYDDSGKQRRKGVHNLVAWSWIGPPPSPKHEVAHNDGSKDFNHFENLRWDTRKGNHADLKKHGTSVSGSRNGRAKLNEAAAAEIRRTLKPEAGKKRLPRGSVKAAAKKFGVNRNIISLVAYGRAWPQPEKEIA